LRRAFTITSVALVALLSRADALAQSGGRYEGTTDAGQAFSRGQANSAEGDEFLQDGESRRAMDAYEDAAEDYREALDLDEDFEDARERLGYVLYVMGESTEAVEILQEGLELNPGSLPLRRMMGINQYELGRVDSAVSLLEAVDGQGGATPDVLFILGKHHYESRDYDSAIPYFQRYLASSPEDAQTHGSLGNSYLRTGQPDLALAEFRLVLELDPTNLRARINMGDVYFASRDYERAIEIYLRVIPEEPGNIRLWFNLGKSRIELAHHAEPLDAFEHVAEALDAFEHVVELRDDIYQGHYFVGVAQLELGNYTAARAALGRGLERNPSHAMSHYRMGVLESHLDDFEAAAEAHRAARELNPEEPWFALSLGDSLRRLGRTDEALEQHRTAVSMDGDEAAFRESLGRDLFALGQLDEVIGQLERGLLIDPGRASLADVLSISLLHRARQSVEAADFEAARLDLARSTQIGAYPLETSLAHAGLALAMEEIETARLILDTLSPRHSDALPYRRSRAYLAWLDGEPARIGELLLELTASPAETLDPRDAGLLGLAAAAGGDWERAVELFERAGETAERYSAEIALSHLRVGLAAADRRRWAEARRHFSEAHDRRDALGAEDALRAELGLGSSEIELGDTTRAIRHLRSVRDALPRLRTRDHLPRDRELGLEVRLAYAYYRNGDYEEAIELLEELRGGRGRDPVEPLLASAHERLAMGAYASGELRSARRHLEAALDITSSEIVENNLGCVLYREGDRSEAGELFRNLAESGDIIDSIYNYAVYLDEVEHDAEGAYRFYLEYVVADGDEATRALEFMEAKEAVFGFGND
jgi:tetratricopeptide (TPR) repeat protein